MMIQNRRLLREKWIKNNDPSKCVILSISSSDDLSTYSPAYSALSELNEDSRLYIIGHSEAGDLTLSLRSVETIAKFLALHLNKDLFKLKNNSKLKISLIVCQAAVGLDGKDLFSSFASMLSQMLMKENICTEILARVKIVTVEPDVTGTFGRKGTLKFSLSDEKMWDKLTDSTIAYKQPGSKIIFSFFESKKNIVQVAQDAYSATWKHKVIEMLGKNIQMTSSPEIKASLEELQGRIKLLPPLEALDVLEVLDEMLNLKDSSISQSKFYIFFQISSIKHDFQSLLIDGRHFLLNQNTSPTQCRII